ncbi:ATP-dependent DNA helicase RecG [Frankia sp. CNm7]|uniref:Probable DNA 3'-5' helicase RecG n=1 Tax=Frankia nepalensis TaxID=1836974 RepID=A0A937RP52_9ACTN|nr:ATP-dependent DNA helicase RecG [Frankia nepalensis]MBL7497010.1 ATP-dependent DNA helicase RecG [Frankia nepalensis]MBL7510522.1 ATP-dependent DNA helicase RecG [Frankia nepalensis]MBL7520981.1 ATP-dependent DNA helicase RecG [Frankia nepalensis]MBL7632440.1 ATP-dependent DNA helicase RecG [Frankia nepalensis]
MIELDTPLTRVVGARDAKRLADGALGLVTVADLLDHLPRRYHQRGELTVLADLVEGEVATVHAKVVKHEQKRDRSGRPRVSLTVTDGTAQMVITYFNPSRSPARRLSAGVVAVFSGKVGRFRERLQMVNPETHPLEDEEAPGDDADAWARALVPVYAATEQVASPVIGRCILVLLDALTEIPDPLPGDLRARHRLVDLRTAYELAHRPDSRGDVERAHRRLKWDEALTLQVILARRRREIQAMATTARVPRRDGILAAFDRQLPFALTDGQRDVGATVQAELAEPVPMHRLLQGEVGSGKTVVALRAMLTVVDAGGQAALLAPTETLATQHYRGIRELLGGLGRAGELDETPPATRIALLTGSVGARARREALAAAADGRAGLVIGTHALLHEGVAFRDLGLVVVDEQHRFGVEQRDALRARASQPPHVLVMTATPIPRTVAMTVFGDLEVSTLTQLPAGRQPISTFVVDAATHPTWRDRIWGRIRDEVAAGHQAYVVCPRISSVAVGQGDDEEVAGDDEAADGAARRRGAAGAGAATGQTVTIPAEDGSLAGAGVEELTPWLAEGPLAGLRLAALHGRLAADVKDSVMTRFAAGELDVLVATTVIEVGVDVPNATVIAIMDADRFGVSQLHQLRGRVGRGQAAGVCLLHTEVDGDTPATQRLANVAATTDGAELARLDLGQRREGDVLGASQSGRARGVRLLELLRDERLILDAREEAGRLVAADPDLAGHPALRRRIELALDDRPVEFLEKG